jgi:hypothetical protein
VIFGRDTRGSATDGVPGFFDDYPRFQETSQTSAALDRLNLRHHAIIAENAALLHEATVLDIASHDGRWTMAALAAGAAHVTSIEARPELVANAAETFAAYDVSPDRYTLITGDVFDVLAREQHKFDVILCLGFLYHTLRYPELMLRLRECNPRAVILDTEVMPGRQRALIRLADESVAREGNAVADDYTLGDRVLTGRPTVPAIAMLAAAYGFEIAGETDWPALLHAHPGARGVNDYRTNRRVTLVLNG